MRFLGSFSDENAQKLSSRVQDLEETINKLERRIKALELDWENAYDRLHSLMGRVSKRAQVAQKAEEMHEYAESQHSLTPLSQAEEEISRFALTQHQRGLQHAILSRRKQNGGQ